MVNCSYPNLLYLANDNVFKKTPICNDVNVLFIYQSSVTGTEEKMKTHYRSIAGDTLTIVTINCKHEKFIATSK